MKPTRCYRKNIAKYELNESVASGGWCTGIISNAALVII